MSIDIYLLVIQNISLSYDIPSGLIPVLGLLDDGFVKVSEHIVSRIIHSSSIYPMRLSFILVSIYISTWYGR